MLKRSVISSLLIIFAQATIQAQSTATPVDLRILVEGDPPAARALVEAMRRSISTYDLKLQFADRLSDPHDARLIVAAGKGDVSCFFSTDPCHTGYFYFTVSALAPDGRHLFTAARSGPASKQAAEEVAAEAIRNLSAQARTLKERGQGDSNPSAGQGSVEAGLPPEPGVYHKEKAAWVMLREGFASGGRLKGAAAALLTFGIAEMRFNQVYAGAQAAVQLSERRPVFYARGSAVSEADAYIARLEKKKDNREIQVAELSGFNPRAGYRPRDLFRITVERVSEGVYKITPASELEPGEYMLSLSSSGLEGVYEFGIGRVKK
ncbi:MAG TPA: hypothetical protein VE262_10970 [Blastocatellia bacterium]|nr:hypothetical protein [Blastocatellia bacterium]